MATAIRKAAGSGKRIVVANPHGFCLGVIRAVSAAEKACERFPAPVYCLNEIVHNSQVVAALRSKGVVFVSDLREVPVGGTVLFSAHGVSPDVRGVAVARRLLVIDATCPFVEKVHAEVRRWSKAGKTVVLVGSARHDEIKGVRGEAPEHVVVIENADDAREAVVKDSYNVAVATQTTLSMAEVESVMEVLRARFPGMAEASRQDVCYATRNRQAAVSELAKVSDFVIVLGSSNSANSRRLVEVASKGGKPAALVSGLADIGALPIREIRTLGITSGASTPESFLTEVLDELAKQGFGRIEQLNVVSEAAHRFKLPRPLQEAK